MVIATATWSSIFLPMLTFFKIPFALTEPIQNALALMFDEMGEAEFAKFTIFQCYTIKGTMDNVLQLPPHMLPPIQSNNVLLMPAITAAYILYQDPESHTYTVKLLWDLLL
jgi:hypothetical protein